MNGVGDAGKMSDGLPAVSRQDGSVGGLSGIDVTKRPSDDAQAGVAGPFRDPFNTLPAANPLESAPEAVDIGSLGGLVSSVLGEMAAHADHSERVQARVRPEAVLKLLT